ncbi:MAG: hypothetical protein MZV70_41910 [Desulfobacterales bacterium]|nr:hypothetical protein [Desulfobacterales bacterium]
MVRSRARQNIFLLAGGAFEIGFLFTKVELQGVGFLPQPLRAFAAGCLSAAGCPGTRCGIAAITGGGRRQQEPPASTGAALLRRIRGCRRDRS